MVRKSKNDSLSLWIDFERFPKESDLNEIKKWMSTQKEIPFEEKLEDKQFNKKQRVL